MNHDQQPIGSKIHASVRIAHSDCCTTERLRVNSSVYEMKKKKNEPWTIRTRRHNPSIVLLRQLNTRNKFQLAVAKISESIRLSLLQSVNCLDVEKKNFCLKKSSYDFIVEYKHPLRSVSSGMSYWTEQGEISNKWPIGDLKRNAIYLHFTLEAMVDVRTDKWKPGRNTA